MNTRLLVREGVVCAGCFGVAWIVAQNVSLPPQSNHRMLTVQLGLSAYGFILLTRLLRRLVKLFIR